MKNNRIGVTFSKPGLLILALILLVVVAIFLFHKIASSRPNFINNCSEAKLRRLTNIPEGSIYYRPELDRDNDKIACEA